VANLKSDQKLLREIEDWHNHNLEEIKEEFKESE
jgi:hypothetical protein